jgi:hypothetical protein
MVFPTSSHTLENKNGELSNSAKDSDFLHEQRQQQFAVASSVYMCYKSPVHAPRTASQNAKRGLSLIRQASLTSIISPRPRSESVRSIIDNAISISTSNSASAVETATVTPIFKPKKLDSIVSSSNHTTASTVSSASTASSDDVSAVVQRRQQQQKQHVYFDLSKTHVIHANPTHFLTEQVCIDAWYTPEEFFRMRRTHDNLLAVFQRKDKQALIEQMNEVVQFCNQAPQAVRLNQDDLADAARRILPKTRGLEAQVLPVLGGMTRKHMKSVMDYIDKIPKKLRPELRDRMLSARSMQYSRPHALLAEILGRADAEIAKQCMAEDTTSSASATADAAYF